MRGGTGVVFVFGREARCVMAWLPQQEKDQGQKRAEGEWRGVLMLGRTRTRGQTRRRVSSGARVRFVFTFCLGR